MMIKESVILSIMFVSFGLCAGFQESASFTSFQKRLSLRAVENQTLQSSFKIYYSNGESLALLEPKSIFLLKPEELFLQQNELFCLQCVKGSFLPIYLKDEGRVSGQAPEGFYGPFYISMWLNYPDVPEDQKQYVRYVVKIGCQAEFCIRINPQGDCQLIALSNMELLP